MRYCERCGRRLARKRFNGRLEDLTLFMRKKFCSLRCANTRGNWGESLTARHRVSSRHRKPCCENCGTAPPNLKHLHVHHKNLDYHDNREENLTTLCMSCHMKMHRALERLTSRKPLGGSRCR